MHTSITAIILTFNEQKHIARCIESVQSFASEIIVVDSFSTDRTIEIAEFYEAKVYQNKFINQAVQLNWGIENCKIHSDWIIRIDADEIAMPKLEKDINQFVASLSDDVSGVTINRQIHFLGKWIRRGGIYPISSLRLWRNGMGKCENRWMDEHIIVKGSVQHFDGDIADINLNNLTWWTDKHNNYSSREAIEILLMGQGQQNKLNISETSKQAAHKRWVKENIYSKLPSGFRAFAYFIYRYFLRLGFLDGWQGLTFHVLQGFWYRFLVDLKVYELEQIMKKEDKTLEEVIYSELGYKIGKIK